MWDGPNRAIGDVFKIQSQTIIDEPDRLSAQYLFIVIHKNKIWSYLLPPLFVYMILVDSYFCIVMCICVFVSWRRGWIICKHGMQWPASTQSSHELTVCCFCWMLIGWLEGMSNWEFRNGLRRWSGEFKRTQAGFTPVFLVYFPHDNMMMLLCNGFSYRKLQSNIVLSFGCPLFGATTVDHPIRIFLFWHRFWRTHARTHPWAYSSVRWNML